MIKYSEKYPEGPASALAGEIDEKTAWQILHDIARSADTSRIAICPDTIFIDNSGFALAENNRGDNTRYKAPEGYSASWALAASVFFIFMGIKMATDGVLRGIGNMRPFLIANMVNLAIRLSVALIFAPRFDIAFVWLAVPAGWLANFVISYVALRKSWSKDTLA